MFGMQQQVVSVKHKTKIKIQIQISQKLKNLLQHKTKQIASKPVYYKDIMNNN